MQGYTCHFTSHLTQLSLIKQGKHQLDFKKEGKIIKLKNSDKIAIRVESMATRYAYMVFPLASMHDLPYFQRTSHHIHWRFIPYMVFRSLLRDHKP
jgi:hypothetical protein